MLKFTDWLNFKTNINELYTRFNDLEYYVIPSFIKDDEDNKISELMECYNELVRLAKIKFNLGEKNSNKELYLDCPEFKALKDDRTKLINAWLKILKVIKASDFHRTVKDKQDKSTAFEFRIYNYLKRLGINKVPGKSHIYVKIKFSYVITTRGQVFGTKSKKKYGLTPVTRDEESIIVDINKSKLEVISIHF